MIVCLCHGINDRELRSCIEDGHRNLRSVESACGAGGDCGRCRNMIRRYLDRDQDGTQRPRGPGFGN